MLTDVRDAGEVPTYGTLRRVPRCPGGVPGTQIWPNSATLEVFGPLCQIPTDIYGAFGDFLQVLATSGTPGYPGTPPSWLPGTPGTVGTVSRRPGSGYLEAWIRLS